MELDALKARTEYNKLNQRKKVLSSCFTPAEPRKPNGTASHAYREGAKALSAAKFVVPPASPAE